MDKLDILSHLAEVDTSVPVSLAKALLADNDTRAVSEKPILVKVSEARHLWETRMRNTQITGQTIYGAQSFIERLLALDPNAKIKQFGFMGTGSAGNIFFDKHGEFIGLIIVNSGEVTLQSMSY